MYNARNSRFVIVVVVVGIACSCNTNTNKNDGFDCISIYGCGVIGVGFKRKYITGS